MKLATFLAGSTYASQAFREARNTPNSHVCGSANGVVGQNTTISDEVELGPGESCIYRIHGDGEHPFEVKDFHFDIPCEYGSISLISDYEEIGPFCMDGSIDGSIESIDDHRHRRNAYGNAATDMQGHTYNSKEMDMVMTNGQRARFRFGFNFEFELLPGLPMAGAQSGGMCPFKGIKAANAAFYSQYPDNKDANDLFNQLTESMYKFNCYYDRYRDQCKGNGPVHVGCHLMDFSDNSHKPIMSKVEAIIDAQCANCRGGAGAVCTEWYLLLAQIKYKCKGHTDPVTPAPCGPDECYDGSHTCGDNAVCVNTCEAYTCACAEGYFGDGYECCDENQCDAYDACPANSSCVNECIGHKCICDDGFHKEDGECKPDCDEDQCAYNNGDCGEYADCVNECDGHKCICHDGYHKENGKCVPDCDENQCNGENDCDENATCSDKCDGYECKCNDGWYGNGKKCCDANQCNDKNSCGAYTKCVNKCVSYDCVCQEGFIPLFGSNPLACAPEDPCYGVKCQKYAECKDGTCKCKNGYYEDDEGNCIPKVNECVTGSHNCAVYAHCEDTLTSYTCTCHDGYVDVKGDGSECTHPYYLDTGMCYLDEYSAFTNKKFEKIAMTTAYGVQEAISAWETITAQLDLLGDKAKGQRTVECDPMAGYIGCGHIDYNGDATACEWAHSLENVIAVVAEKCNNDWQMKFFGFLQTLRANSCDEPDDCASGNHGCHQDATCTSKAASYGSKYSGYKCTCNEGFYGNGKECYPEKNECELGTHRCHEFAYCVDKSAGYDCICSDDYVGNGYKCVLPVDECALGTHDCHEYATCTDLPNGFMCACKVNEGYIGDGRYCTGPADECSEGTHLCHQFATCTNTYAGYNCKCNEGYNGDGKNCWPPLTCPYTSDTDFATYAGDYGAVAEGDDYYGLCSLKYTKVCWGSLYKDLIGAGVKFCKKNEAFSQFSLLMNDLFTHGKIFDKKYKTALSHYPGPSDTRYGAECDPQAGAVPCHLVNFQNIVSAEDLFNRVEALANHVYGQCTQTYHAQWTLWLARYYNALICPVNECKTGDYTCHAGAKCVDQPKGYDCVCGANFIGDGYTHCDAIDWCGRPGTCNAYANCISGDGGIGYTCECKTGYSGPKCYPDDPCDTNNGGCHENAYCKSTIIGWDSNHYCKCMPGYYGSGKVCDPIQPCEYHNCDVNANCVPHSKIIGEEDYDCVCKDGFKGNGYVCEVYVSPCTGHVCSDGMVGKVVANKYGQETCVCQCADGFKPGNGGCVPMGPCDNNNCHPKATCIAIGTSYSQGFTCQCNDGLEGDGVNKCAAKDVCNDCHTYATCTTMPGYSGLPVKKCVCKAPYIGDGYNCKKGATCSKNCPGGSICWDGTCVCANVGYWYDWGSKKCLDKNECKKATQNNCSPNATCKNTVGGFICNCKAGFAGDGVTCVKNNGAAAYSDNANPYVSGGSKPVDMPTQGDFNGGTGVDISLFASLPDGKCSIMGYNWAAVAAFTKKLQWMKSYEKNESIKALNLLFAEFQRLGKAVLVRQGPSCNTAVAGAIDCKLLYFPHSDKKCALVKRIEKVYKAVATSCNQAWISKFGGAMDKLLQINSKFQGGTCPAFEWL